MTKRITEHSDKIQVCHHSGDDIPECGTCQCPLTVKHMLIDCVYLNDVRNKHLVVSSIKGVFDNIEAHKIIGFIKETRFYKQL